MDLKLIDDHQGLIQFKEEWEDFSESHFPELFNSYIWNVNALQNFFTDSPFIIFLFYQSNRLVGILPFCLSRSTFVRMPVRKYDSFEQAIGLTSLMILGEHLEKCLTIFFDSMKRHLSPFHTLRLTLTAAQFERSGNYLKNLDNQGFKLFSGEKKVMCLEGKSKEDLLSQIFSKKRRHEFRRMRRRLQKQFPLKTEHTDAGLLSENLDTYWHRFIWVYKNSWKIKSYRSVSEKSEEYDFYHGLFRDYGQRKKLFFSSLLDDDRDIAVLWSIEHQGIIYPLQVTYNQNYHKYSPGTFLIQSHLITLIKNGFCRFNYMGPQKIKTYFGNTAKWYYDINILNKGIYSQFLRYLVPLSRKPLAPLKI